jgi:hypothetical protein
MRITISAFIALVLAGAVHAAGPSPGVLEGGQGVSGPQLGKRFVTLVSGSKTVVAEIQKPEGHVSKWRLLPGSFGVPVVAFDGTTDGISADGSTLVLAAYPEGRPARTRFAVLNASNLRVRRLFSLRGRFGFDAISPDGRTIYLIQYLSPLRPRYVVRAYDLERGLLPQTVRDPREKERTMHGYPMARTASADGRWVYTLYSQPEVHSFVHALDTTGRKARCIDLPASHGPVAAAEIEMREDGDEVVVRSDAGDVLGVIDTRTQTIQASAEDAATAVEALRAALVFV